MKITNKYGIPKHICLAIDNGLRDATKDNISVTKLIDSPKIYQYHLRHSDAVTIDYADMAFSFHGQMKHAILENIDVDGLIKEKPVKHFFGDYWLTGRFDAFDTKTETLYDYKETSVWSYLYNPKGKKEWENQLNVYAWLIQNNGIGTVKNIKVILIMRDWTKSEAMKSDNYPKTPYLELNIPLWSSPKQFEYINKRVQLHLEAMHIDNIDRLECTAEERWEKPTTYAVMKPKQKRAVRVFDGKATAEKMVTDNEKSKLYIETRQGASVRCESYCPFNTICKQAKEAKNAD